ncbi:hypothetical protein QBC43DRAFT_285385 [Cladorrhinum sp. PSN259]|nr:hypothetical protein QBC43DRAFT_285385 [Cladorrhinum sp. PSN259]
MKTKRDGLKEGEICGMFHFADLTARYATEASSYLIYADAFDPVIEDGWTIKPVEGDVQMNLVPPPKTEEAEPEEPVSKRRRLR